MDLYQTPFLPAINEEKQCLGVISERDIVKVVANYGAERAMNMRVSEVMTQMVACVLEHQDVTDVLTTMFNGKWKRMPVVNDAFEIIGMLNRVDVLQALFEGSIFYDLDARS